MKEVSKILKNFKKFSEEEISSAILELKEIKKEDNRKHLQRLVYTNLVNRFDALVDNLLLIFGTEDQNEFRDIVLNKVKDVSVSSMDFYQIILADDLKSAAKEKVEDLIRLHFLRDGHSRKLRVLFESCLQIEAKEIDRPHVNANDGRIIINTHQGITTYHHQ